MMLKLSLILGVLALSVSQNAAYSFADTKEQELIDSVLETLIQGESAAHLEELERAQVLTDEVLTQLDTISLEFVNCPQISKHYKESYKSYWGTRMKNSATMTCSKKGKGLSVVACPDLPLKVVSKFKKYLRTYGKITLDCSRSSNSRESDNKDILTTTTSTGVTYTRWGHDSCPQAGETQLLYSGIVAGGIISYWKLFGSGANYMCLSKKPKYNGVNQNDGVNKYAILYGAKYGDMFIDGEGNSNIPCASCYAPRGADLMIPGTTDCPVGWNREYYGYLMSADGEMSNSQFVCVDKNQVSLSLSGDSRYGAFLFHAQINKECVGIPCPPYNSDQALTCAVCTK